jgi:two-component system sensor histidine kinase CpxA
LTRLQRLRHSLTVHALLIASLNAGLVLLLGLVMMGTAYGHDLLDFVRAPVGDRILAVSRKIALDLLENDSESWDGLLEREAQGTPFKFTLLDSDGRQIAGDRTPMPKSVQDFSNNQNSKLSYTPKWDETDRPDNSYLKGNFFLTWDKQTHMYWAGVHVLIHFMDENMYGHGTLIWHFPRLWTNTYFFNVWPYALLLVGALVLTILCWLPAVGLLLRRVSRLTAATREIAKGNFDTKLPTSKQDEIGQLSASVAMMSRQISGLMQQQQRFVSDAAHELCSPVSRMQMAIELLQRDYAAGTLLENDDDSHDRDYIAGLAEEVQQMSELIQDLLFYSRTRNSPQSIKTEDLPLDEVVKEMIDREGLTGKTILTDVPPGLSVRASAPHLKRALANLLRNAQQYAGDGGKVEISAYRKGDSVHVFVRDNGPGIPTEELGQVFAPFYRVELARSRSTGGTGLGLAIVKSSVEACGGTVQCRNRQPHGLEVEIKLQAAGESEATHGEFEPAQAAH